MQPLRPFLRSCRPLAIWLILGLVAAPALAQDITLQDVKVFKTSKGYKITGKFIAEDLNQTGIAENEQVSILADVKLTDEAVFPESPTSMVIRRPPDAETSFTRNGKFLTREELHGKDVKIVKVAGFPDLRGRTVWREHGGLGEWQKNAPATVEKTFEGFVPLEYGDRPVRIRARLRYQFGGPHAAWSAYVFRHDIWEIHPDLETVAVIDVTDPELGDPEILALMEKIRKEREYLAKLQKGLAADQATLAKLQGKYDAALLKGSGIADSGYTVGTGDFTPEQLDIITDAGGGPSMLQDMCPVIGAQTYGKQVEMMKQSVEKAKEVIAEQKKKIAELQKRLNKLIAQKTA